MQRTAAHRERVVQATWHARKLRKKCTRNSQKTRKKIEKEKEEKQQIPSKMSSYYAKRNRCASSNGTVNGLSASLSRTSFFLAFFMRIFAFFLRFFSLLLLFFYGACIRKRNFSHFYDRDRLARLCNFGEKLKNFR